MMRAWIWLAIGLSWLIAVFVWTFDFNVRRFGSFGVHIAVSKWIPRYAAPYLAVLILCAVLLGWVVPVGVGIYRLISRR